MKPPEFLYHASTAKDLTVIEPHNRTPRFDGEADYVFATPHKAVAAMFLIPRSVSAEIQKHGDRHVVFIVGSRATFNEADHGGAIYTVPGVSFETDTQLGMGETEWVSSFPVRPVATELFDTALQAMKAFAVETYFVDEAAFERVKANPSKALKEILKL